MSKNLSLLLLVVALNWPAQAVSAPVILVLGDSLSSAYGLTDDQGWVALLEKRLQDRGYSHRVVNTSVSGDTTANVLSRLATALSEHRPDVVLVELGGNDGLRAQPVAGIRENMTKILAAIREHGAKIVLAGMRLPPNYGAVYVGQFERIYPELARRFDAALVPFFLEGVATVPGMMQEDGIHPAAAAQPRLLDNIWPQLEAQLQSSTTGG